MTTIKITADGNMFRRNFFNQNLREIVQVF